MTFSISIVICTHNRASELKYCLRSIFNYSTDDIKEILVVDNASTDQTKNLITNFSKKIPNLRYIYEQKQGLPYARNCGWKNATGDIIYYLDDDATLDSCTINELKMTYERELKTRSVLVVGTRVLPKFIGCKGYPDWLHDDYIPYLTQLDLGNSDRELNHGEFLVGASFSLPRKVLEKIGGFNEEISLFGNDERWVENMVKNEGGTLIYSGSAIVHHAVTTSRLKKKWFFKRLYQEGFSSRRMFLKLNNCSFTSKIKSLTKHTIIIIISFLIGFILKFIRNGKNSFRYFCKGFESAGHIHVLLRELF